MPFFLAVGLGTFALPLSRAEEPETWQTVLRGQLRQSHNCRLDRVIYVRELHLGQDTGLEGRVRCIEGSEYEFTRSRPHQKFEIRLCQPVVC